MENWIIGSDTPESVLRIIREKADLSKRSIIVCFDYFDTLVTRCVEPERTKKLASELLSHLLRNYFTSKVIYRYRKELERSLCLASAEKSGELEFSFQELGAHLWFKLKKHDEYAILTDRDLFIKDMLKIEVAVEKAVQEICPEVLQVIKTLHSLKFTILLISDFYLPEREFREILSGHNLDYLFTNIYISAEHGMSKGSGRIYPMICEKLGVDAAQLLMIGDNPHADIKMSEQNGLKAIHLQRPTGRTLLDILKRKHRVIQTNKLRMFQQITLPKNTPFSEMGVSLWFFIHRLFEELNRNNVRDVFFLSKEGELLKKIFDRYQVELFGSVKINAHYLLASRKSTFIASLRSLDEEDFLRIFEHYHDISIKDFLQSLNLEPNVIRQLCEQLPCDCDQRLENIHQQDVFMDLLDMELFQNVYEARRKQQRSNFICYLRSFGVDFKSEGLHLVDVGWKGSIQDNIFYILSSKVAVRGYYIGSFNATQRSANNTKKGLLFDNYPHPSPYFGVYNCNRSLFEMMLGASHGSADCYMVSPLTGAAQSTDCVAYKEIVVDSGGLFVMTLDLPQERQLYETDIKPLQHSMLGVTSQLNRAYMITGFIPSVEWFARHHARMVFKPRRQEISFFERLYHLENFGIFEFTDFGTHDKVTLKSKVHNLIIIMRNPAVLESGIWPPIILKRLGLGWVHFVDGRCRHKKVFPKS